MTKMGRLFVFEGPDGVGKSTLSSAFAEHLRSSGKSVLHSSFPGRDKGTLGALVYVLHHKPSELDVQQISHASLQTLHIAAHLDAIERRIIPAMEAGRDVVLDRFWWSTWVYGIVDGVSPALLTSLLAVEKEQWGDNLPYMTFLVTRQSSLRPDETNARWQNLARSYDELAGQEASRYPVCRIENQSSVAGAMDKIEQRLLGEVS